MVIHNLQQKHGLLILKINIMYKKYKSKVEHNELILENSHGDKVIIPAK